MGALFDVSKTCQFKSRLFQLGYPGKPDTLQTSSIHRFKFWRYVIQTCFDRDACSIERAKVDSTGLEMTNRQGRGGGSTVTVADAVAWAPLTSSAALGRW
jgi:hypothetical protein